MIAPGVSTVFVMLTVLAAVAACCLAHAIAEAEGCSAAGIYQRLNLVEDGLKLGIRLYDVEKFR